MANLKIAIIGVPTNGAGTADGVARAPNALREAGLIAKLAQHAEVRDAGDVTFREPTPVRDPKTGIIAPDTMVDMIMRVQDAVARELAAGWFPLVLGGDCALMLGCLYATKRKFGQPGLLFIDGHEDAYPPHQSPTGESADMEMGFALGLHHKNLPRTLANFLPLITTDDVALLGIRDGDILKQEGVASIQQTLPLTVIGDKPLMAGDAIAMTKTVLAMIHAGGRHWWLHTDLDVLSSEAFAAVDYLQPGGLSWEVLTQIVTQAVQHKKLTGWDITIYNPDLDTDGQGAHKIITYIEAVVQTMAQSTALT